MIANHSIYRYLRKQYINCVIWEKKIKSNELKNELRDWSEKEQKKKKESKEDRTYINIHIMYLSTIKKYKHLYK